MSLTDEQCEAMRIWANKTALDEIDALRADLARKDELIAAWRDSLDAEYDWGIKAREIMCAERNWEHFLGPLKDLQDKCNTARARLAEVEGEK